ncbi:Phospholipase C [Melia azedarach]|uniref:Phospholipase C n=1 Tax=Melia azedarach TaxID=155640 RepID=A0ACC1WY99_MELAZ|nr:Phospholipase C [Melia azedarach]
MGAMFSKHFKREEQQTKAVNSSNGGNSSSQEPTSIIEFIKPECLKIKKNKQDMKKKKLNPYEKTITKPRKLTLEDWLVASPGPSSRPEYFNGGELNVLKQFSKKVHPSSARIQEAGAAATSTSRTGDCSTFSCSMEASSVSRSQSGKLKKKVTFKSPEEADIILFYSPPETIGSHYVSL